MFVNWVGELFAEGGGGGPADVGDGEAFFGVEGGVDGPVGVVVGEEVDAEGCLGAGFGFGVDEEGIPFFFEVGLGEGVFAGGVDLVGDVNGGATHGDFGVGVAHVEAVVDEVFFAEAHVGFFDVAWCDFEVDFDLVEGFFFGEDGDHGGVFVAGGGGVFEDEGVALDVALGVVGVDVHDVFSGVVDGPCGVFNSGVEVAGAGEEVEAPVLAEGAHEELAAVDLFVGFHLVFEAPAGGDVEDGGGAGEVENHAVGVESGLGHVEVEVNLGGLQGGQGGVDERLAGFGGGGVYFPGAEEVRGAGGDFEAIHFR